MTTTFLRVEHITGAEFVMPDRVYVNCTVSRFGSPDRKFIVSVTASDVAVYEEAAATGKPSDVVVEASLVDATRRLYNLVGVA